MAKLEPIVTQTIDNRITAAKCSECGESLDIPNEVGSVREQEYKLEVAFGKHLTKKHPEDFSQAAARIVREATEKD
jgi:hypothetical protein